MAELQVGDIVTHRATPMLTGKVSNIQAGWAQVDWADNTTDGFHPFENLVPIQQNAPDQPVNVIDPIDMPHEALAELANHLLQSNGELRARAGHFMAALGAVRDAIDDGGLGTYLILEKIDKIVRDALDSPAEGVLVPV